MKEWFPLVYTSIQEWTRNKLLELGGKSSSRGFQLIPVAMQYILERNNEYVPEELYKFLSEYSPHYYGTLRQLRTNIQEYISSLFNNCPHKLRSATFGTTYDVPKVERFFGILLDLWESEDVIIG